MKRALVSAPILLVACAKLLSYDDYSERPAATADTSVQTDSADEAAVDAALITAHPPARPEGERKPSGKGKTLWLAVKRYHFGEQNLDGVYAKDAFRYWGFDIDNVCTSAKDSADNVGTCKRHPMGTPNVLTDGDDCRDNNFGQFVVPIIHTYSANFEQNLNDGIFAGSVTWILRIDDLDDGPDDAYAPGKLYRTTNEKGAITPKWDGTDVRAILSDSVVGGDVDHSVNELTGGYVKGNVWVAGDPQAQALIMPVAEDLQVKLSMQGMVMTAELDPAHGTANRGMIGGGVPFTLFEEFLRPLLARAGVCSGSPIFEGLLANTERTVDLVANEPNLQNTEKTCDTLSIGIGVVFSAIQPVTQLVDPLPTPPTKCDDAGTD
ncbi:MAG: hypothetical protein ACXWUG_03760 [Polyangiales bacterium]